MYKAPDTVNNSDNLGQILHLLHQNKPYGYTLILSPQGDFIEYPQDVFSEIITKNILIPSIITLAGSMV